PRRSSDLRPGHETHRLRTPPEHDGPHGGALVLHGEIPMARCGLGKVGYLAAHPDARKIAFQQRAHPAVELAYRPYPVACRERPIRLHDHLPLAISFHRENHPVKSMKYQPNSRHRSNTALKQNPKLLINI